MKKPWPVLAAIGLYLALILLSLAIPALHTGSIDDRLEGTRGITGPLMPADCLLLKFIGEFARTIPIGLLVLLGASWRFRFLLSPWVISILSIGLAAFMAFYIFYCWHWFEFWGRI